MSFKKIAITGGMGCGKSTASLAFESLGVLVLDADKLAQQALANDVEVRKSVVSIFGESAYLPDGTPNRKAIADIVFADKQKLISLEKILHPAVRKIWESAAEKRRKECESNPALPQAIVVEVPLLFEKELEKHFDFCITVFCSETLRMARLKERGMSPQEISARDAFQLPQKKKIELADIALFNETSCEFLNEQVAIALEFCINAK